MRADERRAAIVVAARTAFARDGYDGTSTASIADAAGCSEAVLYRHFPSKLSILGAVLAEIRDRTISSEPPTADPPRLDALLQRVIRDPETTANVRVLLSAIAVAHRDPDVAAAVVEAFGRARAAIVALTVREQTLGRVRGDLPAEEIAWLWQGLLLSAIVRGSVRDDGVADGALAAGRRLAELLGPPIAGRC